jgi:hypothetical protein
VATALDLNLCMTAYAAKLSDEAGLSGCINHVQGIKRVGE